MQRRQFIKSSALTAGMLALYKEQFAFFADPWKITMLSNEVGIFTERGGTVAFLLTKKGIVVVDAAFPEQAGHLITDLKSRSGKPFRMLINTHHHPDHTAGNIAFKGIVDHVAGHENCYLNQKRVAEQQKNTDKQLFADIIFGESWKYKLGSEKIRTWYYGPAHTDGDAVIHFEHANIAHVGDLVFNRRYPVIDKTAGADIKNWIDVLEKVQHTFDDKTLFIFGHAFDPEKVTGNKSDLKAMQHYLASLLEFVGASIKAGKSKEEILKATSIPGVTEWQGTGIERSLVAAYEELTTVK